MDLKKIFGKLFRPRKQFFMVVVNETHGGRNSRFIYESLDYKSLHNLLKECIAEGKYRYHDKSPINWSVESLKRCFKISDRFVITGFSGTNCINFIITKQKNG